MAPKAAKTRDRKPSVGGGVKKDTGILKPEPATDAKLAKVGITTGSNGLAAAVYAGQFDRWAGKPTISCTSCNQSTGDIDRHSAADKPKKLLWTQARRTKASAEFAAEAAKAKGKKKGEVDVDDRFPSGSECYTVNASGSFRRPIYFPYIALPGVGSGGP